MVSFGVKNVVVRNGEEQEELVRLYRCGKSHRLRERAQTILLSVRGYRVDALAALFEVDRDTISFWLERWVGRKTDESVESALSDAAKSGRPSKIDETTREDLLALASVGVPNLKAEGMDLVKKKGF